MCLSLLLFLSCTLVDVDESRELAVDCLIDTHYPLPPWNLRPLGGPWPPWAIWSGDHECESAADTFRDAVYGKYPTDDWRITIELKTLEHAYRDRWYIEYPECVTVGC